MSTTSSRSAAAKEAAAAAVPTTPTAPVVPTENPAAYDESRLWRDPPWGDTYYCEQCSTCMRWRYSQRIGGRVCVTSFNFNFPMVIIENQRCNEYRPVPGAEALWVDDYVEEDDEYAREVERERLRRDPDAVALDDGRDPSQRLPRRRPRRRPRRTGPGGAPAGPPSRAALLGRGLLAACLIGLLCAGTAAPHTLHRGSHTVDRDLLYHVQDIEFTNPLTTDEAVLRVRARRDDVSACWLHLGGGPQTIPMERRAGTDRHDFFEARVALPPEGIMYCFTVGNGSGGVQWFTKYGLYEDGVYEKNTHHGLWTLAVSERDVFTTPQWVRDAVFYQIFPERFCNGDPSNDPAGSVPWNARPELANFYGGDLQGVLDKLPYLQDLGVNAIYFNPIFAASTNHKYNTSDYYSVEPSFGDTALLKKLVAACHERGMRVVLDGVFNHVGVDFAPFQDVLKNGRDSRYKDWFFIHSYPVKMHPKPTYACWWNIWELPKLNTENPEVRAYLLDVATHWIRETDIDGWRLDVPEEVPHAFWIDFRKAVKAARPDAYIVGEIWHDGRPWLRGDQFDAVMNYPLREAILALLGATTREGSKAGVKRQDVAAYHTAVQQLLTDLPQQVVEVQFNLLGSHDTERMLTLFQGDARKVRMAVGLLMTAPGAPVIYYGDEVGMEGGRDPDCRRGFPWDGPQDGTTFNWFKRLIALRHEHSALRTGRYDAALVDSDSNVYAFRRTDGKSSLLVLVNPNDKVVDVQVPLTEAAATPPRDLVGDAAITADKSVLLCRLQPFQTVITQLK